jgi:hypothetical protein
MKDKIDIIPSERIEGIILFIRDHKVILDEELAKLYRVETKQLKRQVKRNIDRFPSDFMFVLTREEYQQILRCQNGTSRWGGQRYLPYVFTEQGVAMLSGILHSKRAIQVNIAIMRAFVKLRQLLLSHKELARRLDELEEKYDMQFKVVFDTIRQLMSPMPVEEKKPRIGFHKE